MELSERARTDDLQVILCDWDTQRSRWLSLLLLHHSELEEYTPLADEVDEIALDIFSDEFEH